MCKRYAKGFLNLYKGFKPLEGALRCLKDPHVFREITLVILKIRVLYKLVC